MAYTLLVNPGSSSKKYALFNGQGECVLTVRFERTGDGYGRTRTINGTQQGTESVHEHLYHCALHEVVATAKRVGCISTVADIAAVGVRVVAPGKRFAQHVKVTDEFLASLEAATPRAPLHIPPTVEECMQARAVLPHAVLCGISDSAFHRTIAESQRAYSLSRARELGFERYGYHGLSVASVVQQVTDLSGVAPERMIVAHIGNGVSVTGVRRGRSVWNSMGYTPGSGLMMGSRAGDLDPGAAIVLAEHAHVSGAEALVHFQTEGGFRGLVGHSDLRVVLDQEAKGRPEARVALEKFITEIQQAIASACIVTGGVDVLILTATAMERNEDLRARVVVGLEPLGIRLDTHRNEQYRSEIEHISTSESSARVVVVPTQEMNEMYRICRFIAGTK